VYISSPEVLAFISMLPIPVEVSSFTGELFGIDITVLPTPPS